MPRLLVLELAPDQRSDVEKTLRRRDLAPHTRTRAECVRLSGRGRTSTEIAEIAAVHPVTVRGALRRHAAAGCRPWLTRPAPAAAEGHPRRSGRAGGHAGPVRRERRPVVDIAQDGCVAGAGARCADPLRTPVCADQAGRLPVQTDADHCAAQADEALQQIAEDQLEGLRLYG